MEKFRYYDDFIFIPAISIATHTQIMKNDWKIHGKSPRFYLNSLKEDEKIFDHPYILTTAAHNYKNMDFSKQIGINDVHKDVNYIFGDSGGFQIAMGEIKDTPEIKDKLYEWMIKNASVAPVIDHPPTEYEKMTDERMQQFLDNTKKNTEFLLKKNNKDSVLWLNVIQGIEYHHRINWYEQVKDYKLDGWAFGGPKRNLLAVLNMMASFIDVKALDDKKTCNYIHWFGISSTKFMPYMVYFKHKLNMLGYKVSVSLDSSYATQNGGWGKYLLFGSATGFASYHLSNRFIGKFKDVDLPCFCPVCKNVKLSEILNENALKSEHQSYFYNIVQTHNVFVLKEYVRNLQNLIYTDSYELYETAFKANQIKVFRLIDKLFEAKSNSYKEVILKNIDLIENLQKLFYEDKDEVSQENQLDDFFN